MTAPPPCCAPPEASWPWRRHLPHLHFLSTRFDPDSFDATAFSRHRITPPAALHRAVAKRQAEYLAGRVCAREALAHSAGLDAIPGSSDTGAPSWPAGQVGSITHSQTIAAAITGPASHYQSLGLDLEHRVPDQDVDSLSQLILTPGERERFRRELAANAGLWLTRVFSLKESLYKALFPLTGQRFYFEHAEVLSIGPDGTARLRLLMELSTDWRFGQALEGHIAVTADQVLSLIAVPAADKTIG